VFCLGCAVLNSLKVFMGVPVRILEVIGF